MAKFKVKRTVPCTVMLPRGGVIGAVGKDGILETDNPEHIEIITTDVRYDYIEPVEAGKRRAKSDATDSKDVHPQVSE